MTSLDRIPAAKAIRREAADWLARRAGGLTPADAAALDRWLAADPRHAATLAEMESAWAFVNAPRLAGQAGPVRQGIRNIASARRRRHAWGAIGLAAAAALVFALLPPSLFRPAAPAAPSFALRPNLQTLPDGSTVELNAGAAIAVAYTPDTRTVQLLHGEALFAVAKQPVRPFVVQAGGVAFRAVGTQFAVKYLAQEVELLVTEGTVAVDHTTDGVGEAEPTQATAPEPLLVNAGGRLSVPFVRPAALAVHTASATEIAAALAWRGKRVEFTDTPLAEALALFNRQNELQLELAPAASGTHAITGIFWADDPEGFARLLETSLGLRAERAGNRIRLQPR